MDEDVASGDVDNTVASKVVLLSSNVETVRLDTTTEVVLTPLAPGGATSDIGAVMLDTTNEAVLPLWLPMMLFSPQWAHPKSLEGNFVVLHMEMCQIMLISHIPLLNLKHLSRERSIST